MSERLDPQSRLAELLDIACTDAISDAERAELDALLIDNPVAQRDYLDYCQMHSSLLLDRRAQAATDAAFAMIRGETPAADESVPSAASGQRSAKDATERNSAASPSLLTPRSSFETFIRGHNFAIAMAVAFAALAAVVTWMGFSYLPGVAENENKPAAEAQGEVIARLVRVHDIEWADGGVPASTRYKSGQRLAFTKGLVAIRYTTGAEVVIEGPAEYYVGTKDQGERRKDKKKDSNIDPLSSRLSPSENSGYLALGKLVARCDTKASQGFTVCTPYACIEDHGTEFGVDVDERGAAEFVVMTGAVDVISDDGGGAQQRVRLTKNQAAFVATAGGAVTRQTEDDMELVAAMRSRLKALREAPIARADQNATLVGQASFTVSSSTSAGSTHDNLPTSFDSQIAPGAITPSSTFSVLASYPLSNSTDGNLSHIPEAGWANNSDASGTVTLSFASTDVAGLAFNWGWGDRTPGDYEIVINGTTSLGTFRVDTAGGVSSIESSEPNTYIIFDSVQAGVTSIDIKMSNGGGNSSFWGLDEIEVYRGEAPAMLKRASTAETQNKTSSDCPSSVRKIEAKLPSRSLYDRRAKGRIVMT